MACRIAVFPQWGIIVAATQTEAHVFLLKDTKIIDKIDGRVGWGEKDLYVLRNRDMYEVRDLRHRVIYRDSNNIAKPVIVDGWLWYLSDSNWFYGKKLKGKGILGPYASDSIPIREIAFLRDHPVYDCSRCSVKPMGTDRWLIMQGDSVGLSDGQGQLLLPIIYDQVMPIGNWIYVILDGKEGMMDLQGKPFIPAEYDRISPNDCGSFSVSKTVDGKRYMGILDSNGHWVSKLQME